MHNKFPSVVAHKTFSTAKSVLKYLVEALDPLYIGCYRIKWRFTRVLPPMQLRVRVGGSRWIDEFVRVGSMCVGNLEQAILKHCGKDTTDYEKILDFGCGCGRILQYLYWNNSPERSQFYGCDVDPIAIRWMKKNYSNDNFFVNKFEPPMPFVDDFFDLVYAYSVFTHLDENMQFAWLRDISRVVRPGGIALLTIHGSTALQMFIDNKKISKSIKERLNNCRPLVESGFIFEPYEDIFSDKKKYPGIGSVYGLTFHSHSYINEYWNDFFKVFGIYSNEEDNFQEVVVLEKRL